MDALDYIRTTVNDDAVTCDIYRSSESGSYSGPDHTDTGETVQVAIFAPSSSAQIVTEGVEADTSLTGLVVPETDESGNIQQTVQVTDQLRVSDNTVKRYSVRSVTGVPNDLEPELFRVGLEPNHKG